MDWIILLRGINVGGKNIVPMADLRELLAAQGLTHVKTYIQSGNCVGRSTINDAQKLSRKLAKAIHAKFGFQPNVFCMPLETLNQIVADNPYSDAESAPKTLHVFFAAEPPTPDAVAALDALRVPSEQVHVTDKAVYLWAPEGIGRSMLASKMETTLGVALTARNWRTVCKIQDKHAEAIRQAQRKAQDASE